MPSYGGEREIWEALKVRVRTCGPDVRVVFCFWAALQLESAGGQDETFSNVPTLSRGTNERMNKW